MFLWRVQVTFNPVAIIVLPPYLPHSQWSSSSSSSSSLLLSTFSAFSPSLGSPRPLGRGPSGPLLINPVLVSRAEVNDMPGAGQVFWHFPLGQEDCPHLPTTSIWSCTRMVFCSLLSLALGLRIGAHCGVALQWGVEPWVVVILLDG